ncbi:hypothetical protein [Agathobacter sp.]
MKIGHRNDKKHSHLTGKLLCILIIAAVVCAGNLIPDYLISLKAAGITGTSTTISNADVNPYSSTIAADERLTKMMSLMQDNVNDLWNMRYNELREPLDTEIPAGQAFEAVQNFIEAACELQKQLGLTPMINEDDIDVLKKYGSKYSGTDDSTFTEMPVDTEIAEQYGAVSATGNEFDDNLMNFFMTSNISKELSAWVFIMSFEDTNMIVAVDAVLGVPFYITYYYDNMEDPSTQAGVIRDSYAKLYGSDYSMSDPEETDSKIDQFFVANAVDAFYYGYTNMNDEDYYTGIDPYVYYCSSDKVQMEYQIITRYQRYNKKGRDVSLYKSRVNICLY